MKKISVFSAIFASVCFFSSQVGAAVSDAGFTEQMPKTAVNCAYDSNAGRAVPDVIWGSPIKLGTIENLTTLCADNLNIGAPAVVLDVFVREKSRVFQWNSQSGQWEVLADASGSRVNFRSDLSPWVFVRKL